MENRRILLIDDDERSIEIIRKALSAYRVELDIVRQPAGAFERAIELHPRAVVLAVELPPQKQGYALCRRLKKTPETQTLPVVLLSTGDPYFDDHKKLAMHADAYLLKPLNGAEVVRKIEAVSGPLARVDAGVTAEIIEVEDEDLVMPEITIVGPSAAALELRGEDPRDPRRGARTTVTSPGTQEPPPQPNRPTFESQEDTNVFEAMLESLEFQGAPPVKTRLAAARSRATPLPSPTQPFASGPLAPVPAPVAVPRARAPRSPPRRRPRLRPCRRPRPRRRSEAPPCLRSRRACPPPTTLSPRPR